MDEPRLVFPARNEFYFLANISNDNHKLEDRQINSFFPKNIASHLGNLGNFLSPDIESYARQYKNIILLDLENINLGSIDNKLPNYEKAKIINDMLKKAQQSYRTHADTFQQSIAKYYGDYFTVIPFVQERVYGNSSEFSLALTGQVLKPKTLVERVFF